MPKETDEKFEARNPKSEKISNDRNSNDPNIKAKSLYVLNIWKFDIRICFDIRYSNFGFIIFDNKPFQG